MADILGELLHPMGEDQPTLPFPPETEMRSLLTIADDAILEGSLAVQGFDWNGLKGEVFEDGGVCFHDGTEFDVVNYLPENAFITQEVALAMVKIAHGIKTGRITESQNND